MDNMQTKNRQNGQQRRQEKQKNITNRRCIKDKRRVLKKHLKKTFQSQKHKHKHRRRIYNIKKETNLKCRLQR